jgi:hypothetical protein
MSRIIKKVLWVLFIRPILWAMNKLGMYTGAQ